MGFDVGLHLWFGQNDTKLWPALFRECVSVILESDVMGFQLPSSTVIKLKICERGENNILTELKFFAHEFSGAWRAPNNFVARDYLLHADLAFPCILYEPSAQQLEETAHPLWIRLTGPEFGPDGYEYKRNGLIRFTFSNLKVFGIPSELIERTRVAAATGEQDRFMHMISRIARNSELLLDVAAQIILRLNPEHLMICTELEVHPFTAHALYHRNLRDFLSDLNWVAILHDRGGLYLCAEESVHLMAARRQSRDYGYRRDERGATADFIDKLESYLSRLSLKWNPDRVSDDEIRSALSSRSEREVHSLRNSIMLCSTDGPFAYLEDPLFDLFDVAIAASNARVH